LSVREQNAGRLPTRYAYRLPTEAEWEYTCRAGTTSAYFFGDTLSPSLANFAEGHVNHPTPVGSYTPNAFGLYDMHGNVREWCQDWYGPYEGENALDPVG